MKKINDDYLLSLTREIDESEKEAVRQMIFFAKSKELYPTEILKTAINNYIDKHYDLREATLDQKIDHRRIAIRFLIISCIPSCKDSELMRLDFILDKLAESF